MTPKRKPPCGLSVRNTGFQNQKSTIYAPFNRKCPILQRNVCKSFACFREEEVKVAQSEGEKSQGRFLFSPCRLTMPHCFPCVLTIDTWTPTTAPAQEETAAQSHAIHIQMKLLSGSQHWQRSGKRASERERKTERERKKKKRENCFWISTHINVCYDTLMPTESSVLHPFPVLQPLSVYGPYKDNFIYKNSQRICQYFQYGLCHVCCSCIWPQASTQSLTLFDCFPSRAGR